MAPARRNSRSRCSAKGTRQRDSLAIALQRQRLGAQWRAETGLDASHVGVDALNSGLSGALELLAEIVREPAFRQADLERLRAQCLARIRRERADPAALGFRVLPRLLYGADHAYGIPFSGLGSEAAIASISPDALAAFHRDFVRPDRAAIFVVGDTNMETVLPLLDAAFGDWAAPDSPAPMVSRGEVPPQGPPRLFLVDRPGAQQSQIFAARTASPTMAPDHLSTQLANAVFGGAFTSRLNMNLREDKHWSYGAHSTLVEALGPRPLLISAPVQTDRTAEAIGEILGELRAIGGDRPPTEAEIAKVKAQRTRALPGSYETGGAVLSALANNRLYGRGDDYVASLASRRRGADDGAGRGRRETPVRDRRVHVAGGRRPVEGRSARACARFRRTAHPRSRRRGLSRGAAGTMPGCSRTKNPPQGRVSFGARTRNRTGTALRPRDFKSLASTSFAIRAVVRDAVAAHGSGWDAALPIAGVRGTPGRSSHSRRSPSCDAAHTGRKREGASSRSTRPVTLTTRCIGLNPASVRSGRPRTRRASVSLPVNCRRSP